MKRKKIRIAIFIIFICLLIAGYFKGCNSEGLPKQYPLPFHQKDSAKNYNVNLTDSLITVAAGKHYKKNKIHDFIYGSHYRNLWALPVKMKVFDIGKEMGGLKIVKRGGNMQTISLRMENKEGKKYVLRSIDKDNSMGLTPFWKNKIVIYLFRDQTASLHPYGALIIPRLAQAADIPYTNTELFFIPYDKRLGEYAERLEGRVAILEEYPDESWIGSEKFEFAENIINSAELFSRRYNSQKVFIDEKAYARARLFDIFISDWDRHKEQWKWMEYISENKKIYKPIPRLRDMAFYKFDSGVVPTIVLTINNKFQTFDDEYGNIKGLIKNAKYLDGLILNNLSEEEFLSIAISVQKSITDSVIKEAVKSWPEEIYKMTGAETIRILKSRRDNLNIAAKEFYSIVYEDVNLIGTDMKEQFIVKRLNDNKTSVIILNEKEKIIYENVFDNELTKKIALYGLNGRDEFKITGTVDNGVRIDIYGGKGHDEINDQSFVKGCLKKTKVFDSKGENTINAGKETEDNTTNDPSVLYFNRTGEK